MTHGFFSLIISYQFLNHTKYQDNMNSFFFMYEKFKLIIKSKLIFFLNFNNKNIYEQNYFLIFPIIKKKCSLI